MKNYVPTPSQVGSILGASLVEGRRPDDLDGDERRLVEAAGIRADDYFIERLVLSASAAAYASRCYLSSREFMAVALGFRTWFEQSAAASPRLREALSAYLDRVSEYVEAAQHDRSLASGPEGALLVTRLSGAFGDSLLKRSSKGQSAEAACRILALAVTDAYWSAQVEGSVQLFQRAGLISHAPASR